MRQTYIYIIINTNHRQERERRINKLWLNLLKDSFCSYLPLVALRFEKSFHTLSERIIYSVSACFSLKLHQVWILNYAFAESPTFLTPSQQNKKMKKRKDSKKKKSNLLTKLYSSQVVRSRRRISWVVVFGFSSGIVLSGFPLFFLSGPV